MSEPLGVESMAALMRNTWFDDGSGTGTPEDVSDTFGAIKDAVINGYTVETVTSSATWTRPANLSELVVICVGSGGSGTNGGDGTYGSNGKGGTNGLGGQSGGYIAQSLDPSTVAATVACTIGVNGAATSFGSYVTSSPNGGGIATQFGYTTTSSIPGEGGDGGLGGGIGSNASSPTNGATGKASALGGRGSAGIADSSAGGDGGSVSAASTTKCGGGGGGGGGGRSGSGSLGASRPGFAGGAGGYPGGLSLIHI